MKDNIKKLDKDGNKSEDSKFWHYDVYCNKCHKYIRSFVSVIVPDLKEIDLCSDCQNKINL